MITKTSSLAALALVSALALTGCAADAEPASGSDISSPSATPTPEPTFAAGDTVDAAQAEAINADLSDTTVAYPVGDSFVVVSWGEPISPAVREAVTANVKAAAPEWGTSTDHRVTARQWESLRDAMQAESTKLGGITLTTVACAQSFSTEINRHRPTWVISEPGPRSGEYDSFAHARDTAEGWISGPQGEGKRLYVVINNLGCEQ